MARRAQVAPVVPIGSRAHFADGGSARAVSTIESEPSEQRRGRFRLEGPPGILTVTEAATVLRVHRNRVYTLIRAGCLHASRIDGMRKWLVSKAALERLLEQLGARAEAS